MTSNFPEDFPAPKPLYPLNADEYLLSRDLAVIVAENHETADLGRRAAKEPLQVALTFLLRRGFPGQTLHSINRVVKAFEDLEAGIQPELFDLDEPDPDKRKWTRSADGKELKR